MVIPDSGSIHPGLLHQGLLDRAIKAGVAAFGETPVTELHEDEERVRVLTPKGEIVAREVVLATNGYTPASRLVQAPARALPCLHGDDGAA